MTARINLHELARLSATERARLLTRTETDLSQYDDRVRAIIEAVRRDGDKALVRFAAEFDKVKIDPSAIAATEADFDAAERSLDPEVRAAMEFAAGSIRRFHEDQKPEEMWLHEIRPGAFAGDRTRPIPSVACYIPRGKGAFPSVALMTAIPARVAGVKDVIIVTPPGPDGGVDDATLVAARMAGVDFLVNAIPSSRLAIAGLVTECARSYVTASAASASSVGVIATSGRVALRPP